MKFNTSKFKNVFLGCFFSSNALAAEGIPHFIDYYNLVAGGLGFGKEYTAVLASILTLSLCAIIGIYFKSSVEKTMNDVIPSAKISLRSFVEMAMDFLYSLTKEHCGQRYRKFLPLMAGLFLFILVSNLSGLIPGLPPTTENFNTNLAMGLIVFFWYNYAGIKEHGASYIKQFTGPFLVLALLFLPIELISHSVRPLSLAFRLLANIFCDHLLLGVFSGLVPLVIPTLFLFFGLLVAFVQSFVFVLLTGIYVNMAISHDH
ncbi:MAG: F0F1 ATP synthase subunit A [Oligoflexales bacterium]